VERSGGSGPRLLGPSQDRAGVVLVSMPWAPPGEPSLGLGILKASLSEAGVTCTVMHTAPELLKWVSIETYQFLADCWGINEFLFTGELDPGLDDRQQDVLVRRALKIAAAKRHDRYTDYEAVLNLLLVVRDQVVPQFMTECMNRVLDLSPALVGFTCLFDQTMPSLALAARLKGADDALPTAFGGYALEGAAGRTVLTAFPSLIDVLVEGDGEAAIVGLAHQALDNKALRLDDRPRVHRAEKVALNSSPNPDYSDWFKDLERLEHSASIRINARVLPVESSRGCWWGQTKHCVFCGIDEETLKYRAKSPNRTLTMLDEMRETYGEHDFRFSDYIMPKAYYQELLPLLAALPKKFRLQGELKANHPPERVKLLADAGFFEVQPGIESFSSSVLRAMDKGVRSVDNVSLLKSGYSSGIVIDYNILYGLPSDHADDYIDMLARLPLLYHLTPPISCNETVVTRFAPLQADPGRFGLVNRAVHHECYDVLFSQTFLRKSGFELDEYAYYFERNFEYQADLARLYGLLSYQVGHWKALHRERPVELSWEAIDGLVVVKDFRFQNRTEVRLSKPASDLFTAVSERPTNAAVVAQERGWPESQLTRALKELTDHRLVWRERDLVLALPVPREIFEGHLRSGWTSTWMALYT